MKAIEIAKEPKDKSRMLTLIPRRFAVDVERPRPSIRSLSPRGMIKRKFTSTIAAFKENKYPA